MGRLRRVVRSPNLVVLHTRHHKSTQLQVGRKRIQDPGSSREAMRLHPTSNLARSVPRKRSERRDLVVKRLLVKRLLVRRRLVRRRLTNRQRVKTDRTSALTTTLIDCGLRITPATVDSADRTAAHDRPSPDNVDPGYPRSALYLAWRNRCRHKQERYSPAACSSTLLR
jgi:hypothetical protein